MTLLFWPICSVLNLHSSESKFAIVLTPGSEKCEFENWLRKKMIRSFISAAAFTVNVIASTFLKYVGSDLLRTMDRKNFVSVKVLPEPAELL